MIWHVLFFLAGGLMGLSLGWVETTSLFRRFFGAPAPSSQPLLGREGTTMAPAAGPSDALGRLREGVGGVLVWPDPKKRRTKHYLTDEEGDQIAVEFREGQSVEVLAARYNVHPTTVSKVVTGLWRPKRKKRA